MQRIGVIAVSKIKTPWVREASDVFIERLKHFCDFELTEISSGTEKEEEKKLLDALSKRKGLIVLLDEKGKLHTSQTFATFLEKERDRGTELTFVIGGAYGFSEDIKKKYTQYIALSPLTFPHELCRVIFLEQLYRAHTILQGSGYHH